MTEQASSDPYLLDNRTSNLAWAYQGVGRFDDADRLMAVAMDYAKAADIPNSPYVPQNLTVVAVGLAERGRIGEAWDKTREAMGLQKARLRALPASTDRNAAREPRAIEILDNVVRIAHEAAQRIPEQRIEAVSLSFEAAQILQDGDLAATAIRSAQRIGAKDTALGALLRKQEDLAQQRHNVNAELLDALSGGASGRTASARSQLRQIDSSAAAVAAEIAWSIPGLHRPGFR